MQLKTVNYTEFEGSDLEWRLEGLDLGGLNLLVGKNASGKSRTLNIIGALAGHAAGLQPPGLSANYDVEFRDDDKRIRYQVKVDDSIVVAEKFMIDGDVLLERVGAGGVGRIFASQIDGGSMIDFQTPPSEFAIVARRDNIQHEFLERLYSWGNSVRKYQFGTFLGKQNLAIVSEKVAGQLDERDADLVVVLFKKAIKKFGDEFKQKIVEDMASMGYRLEDVDVGPLVSVRITSSLPGELIGLYVREKELPGIVDQYSMSQGMFRALSLLIHVNYSHLMGSSTCIVVDDVGEGLDFERSCDLIDLLRSKAKASNVQLILSTNDRFVMNRVPLEEWSVLQRVGNRVRVLNNDNSRVLFEEFKFTGLSNFSFLEMDFPNKSNASPEAGEG